MSFLPPVVMEIRANAAQFLSEQGKVVASAKATATETEKAAQKEAAAARASAAEATRAAEQRTAAAETSAKAAVVATDKRIAAEARASEASAKAAQMQASSLGVMTAEQQAAYDKQAAAAARAANAVELAAAKESEAQGKAAAAATAAADAKVKADEASALAAEKSAAAQEVAGKRGGAALGSIVGIANKVSAATILAGGAIAGASIEMAAKFEKSTMLLVTAGGEAEAQLDNVRKGLLDTSTQTGTSAEQMAEGMYIMEKAGIRGAAGLSALKMAAEGAKDENVDLGIMTQALTDLLLDYGTNTKDAAAVTSDSVKYTNELVAASGAAKTTMTDFAGSMAAVVPLASTAGISFEQVGGAIATMTQHGQTAQQSSQNLSNLIMSLIRPNNLASAAMQQLGIDTVDLAKNLGNRGLSGTLAIVDKAINDHRQGDLVFQGSMKDNKAAVADLNTALTKMPGPLADAAKGLLTGATTQKEFAKAAKDTGGAAGAVADQFLSLYKSTYGMSDNFKAGKPAAEMYSAALRDVLGNVTAMRAAQMLLMNNSREFEANIKAIGEAGKKTGQDIATWADMQKTLSVQMDQTKAMVSNLGIEMGTKLLPVAKDLVGGFTDLFHGFEQGNPVLWGAADALGALAAIAIGTSLISGIVKIGTSAINMGRDAKSGAANFGAGFKSIDSALDESTGKMGRFGGAVSSALPHLGKMATAAGVAGAALKGLAALDDQFGSKSVAPSLDQTTDAMMRLGKATDGADQIFQNWDSGFLKSAPSDVHNLDDAIGYMNDGWAQAGDTMTKVAGFLPGLIGIKVTSGMDQVNQHFDTMGQSLAQMVSSGHLDDAARGFDQMAKKQVASGHSVQELLDKMPAYRDALLQQVHATGQVISETELHEYAMGKIPKAMQDATQSTENYIDASGHVKPITPELQKSLEDAGVGADGLAQDLGKVLDGMLATGMKTMSTRDSAAAYAKQLRDTDQAVKDVINSQGGMQGVLTQSGDDLDVTTEKGSKLNDALENIWRKGTDSTKAMSAMGASQPQIQGQLQQTHEDLVNYAEQMLRAAGNADVNGTAAENLARNIEGIPKDWKTNTWVETAAAQAAADALHTSIDNLHDKLVHITIATNATGPGASQIDVNMPDGSTERVNRGEAGSYLGGAVADTMGMWTGGSVASIMGFAGGGIIPGSPPSRPNVDNILAMVNGRPLKVRSGEFITNEPATKMNLPWLKASNAGLNLSDAFAAAAQGGAASAPAAYMGAPSKNTTINIQAQTNATATHIAEEVAWALRTQ